MKFLGCLAITCLWLASDISARAAESTPPLMSVGIGSQTCGQFAQDYAKQVSAEIVYHTWAQGLMSGLNAAHIAEKQPIRNLGASDISIQQRRIREYCSAHPLDQYVLAVLTVYGGLPVVNMKY
jgi:hypothetical protein